MKRFSIALIFFSSLLLPLQTFGFKPLEEIGRGFFQSFGADLQRGLLGSPYYHPYPRYPQYYPYYPPPRHYYELDPFVIPSILICMMNTAISKLLSEEHVIESSAFHRASWESGFLVRPGKLGRGARCASGEPA
jgi:hypothetical protein